MSCEKLHLLALGVGEAGPHRGSRPIGRLDEKGAEPALVPARPLEVLQHPGLGINLLTFSRGSDRPIS